MGSYAALVSLEHIIHNLRLHSPPPVSLHKQQAHLLTQKVAFLQHFLEDYNPTLDYSKEADPLESRIACAAYAAEDAIESHILYHFTNKDEQNLISDGLYRALEKVIEDMALIEKEAMEMTETLRFQNHRDSSISSSSLISRKSISMVGADGFLFEMKDKLTSHRLDLQTLPIVGMGGSGKTTLALNVYQDRLIEEYFDIRAWVTVTQEYSILEILKQLLTQLIKKFDGTLSEYELGELLHKHLFGRRFMIIMDDVWSAEPWDGLKRFLPDYKNGSRIVITTRLTTLAYELPNSNILGMKLLDDEHSWDLLSKTVFGEKGSCPSGLEEIGKKIGTSCKGLPLSIVVIGGLLAKSEQTIEFWEYVEGNLNSIVNLEDDERCLKILHMSYRQLPVHLKPCFLYMGIYRDDHVICVSKLVKLWVAEGFLRVMSGKIPEDVARAYIKELTDRNLILIHKLGSIGNIKECKVHDLLRDLCLREGQKEGFYTVHPGQEIENRMSRIVMSETIHEVEEIDALTSAPQSRSLILARDAGRMSPCILRYLRIVGSYIAADEMIPDTVHQLVNSRFLTFCIRRHEFPGSICLFWNLKTLHISHYSKGITAPADIWHMSHIRHLHASYVYLPDPPDVECGGVLANLQSMSTVRDFTCSAQVVNKIPNIKKLKISYMEVCSRSCLTNLDCLEKLESLCCRILRQSMCQINYPRSLEKLSVEVGKSQSWHDMLDKIGALPLLQKLQLYNGTFRGQWETSDGQFCSLKFLSLKFCKGLQVWTSEASHFPRLEELHLYEVSDLQEIPSDFAEISTLRLISIEWCSDSAVESAKRILEEQEALYGEEETTVRIQITLWRDNDRAPKRNTATSSCRI